MNTTVTALNFNLGTMLSDPFVGVDITAVILTFSTMAVYHIILQRVHQTKPDKLIKSYRSQLRRVWVKRMMKDEKNHIIVVQTTRNEIMIASFLASTAVLISLSLLGILIKYQDLEVITRSFNVIGLNHPTLLLIKLLSLIVCYLVAFFNFTVSIRYINLGTLALQCYYPNNEDHGIKPVTIHYVASLFTRAYSHYTFGMRSYYVSLPLLMWIFSPILMVIAMVLLVIFLFFQDANLPFEEPTKEDPLVDIMLTTEKVKE